MNAPVGNVAGDDPRAPLEDTIIATNLPYRLDRLPWSRWHRLVVAGLGITWILDGLEVTVVANVAPVLRSSNGLNLQETQFTTAASCYLIGASVGALFFGWLTDLFGRKKLFMVTLGAYIAVTLLTALSWDFASFAIFRTLTGFALGGEYAAINSAIDELIPSARRGVVDLGINATWWFGVILASLVSVVVLDPRLVAPKLGWRLAFALGAILALGVVVIRRWVPESPRWLLTHGKAGDAARTVDEIEREVAADRGALPPAGDRTLKIDTAHRATLLSILRVMFGRYRKRAFVALGLMCTQAFLYNGFTFTQTLVLADFFKVPQQQTGWFYLPFAIGNLLGPIVLGRYFDSIGRRTMIAATYVISATLLVVTGLLFVTGHLSAVTIDLCWMAVFFFASAGASAAYLTASEIFPLEARALAIAIVFAAGTLAGGAAAPTIFGLLIATKSPLAVFWGYLLAAVIMVAGGAIEFFMGVDAEGKNLEDIAAPLSAA